MRCCVSSCNNTSENTSQSDCITFHSFPSEVHLRAAWLRALGIQDSGLPDSAMVCSQHFQNEDTIKTECGLRQIVIGAIPSTVPVCMICLDTDSKLIPMSKHKLEETFEKLTGHPLCDRVNLKPTLCVQCAQRLINFRKFRDLSLRAQALIMDLIEKHKIITRKHIKMINRTKHQLKSSMVLTTLGPDHCDLHILEHPSEDKQTEFEEIELRAVVKTEESDDSMSVDGDMKVKHEEDNYVNDFVQDPLKSESAPLQCTLCLEEFMHENVYKGHIISVHLQNGAGDGESDTSQACKPHTGVSSSSPNSSLITENKQADPSPSAHAAQTTVVPQSMSRVTYDEINSTEEVDTKISCRSKKLTDCFVKHYDIFAEKAYQRQDVSLMKTQRDGMSCGTWNTVSEDFSHQATSQNELPTTEYTEPVANSMSIVKEVVLKKLQRNSSNNFIDVHKNSSQSSSHTENILFICDVCRKNYKRKSLLVKHIKSHSEVRRFTCKICQYKCKFKSQLITHTRTHTGEKPFTCSVCNSKFAQSSSLVYHMTTHTGIQPFVCELCEFKCAQKSKLVRHMGTHTGEKPFTCNICNSKFARSGDLQRHMTTHTDIKPYACEWCGYRCVQKGNLTRHMRIHSEKLYSCKICEYKCLDKYSLVYHMPIHTGIKPYACELCEYKCAKKSDLARHVRTHSGKKPYSCQNCEFKCAVKSNLVRHMITHTADKPYSCQKCEYKCARKTSLVKHMKNHTSSNP